MAKRRNQVVDYLVYLVVRSVVCVMQALPLDAAYAIARLIARLAYLVDKRHRRVAEENLRHAFGSRLSDADRRRMVLHVYEHFSRMIVEMAFIPRRLHVNSYRRYVRLENAAPAVRAIMGDRPKILVTAHFGNWEMAGYLLAALGMKSYAIARDLDNRYLHDFLLSFRQWSGQTILSKNGEFDRIQKVLGDGELLVSVGDQSAGPRGHFVDFFGRLASTHKAIAILSIKYDAQVLIGYAFRDAPGFHYTVGCSRILDPRDYADRANAPLAMTQDVSRLLEEAIRKAPEQYLWLHNRWKHKPRERATKRRAA